MSRGCIPIVLLDEAEEPVGCVWLAGERDGGEQSAAEPGVLSAAGEGGAQQREGFGRVGLGDGHGGFGGGIVFRDEELRGPGQAGGAFESEDGGVAGAEQFGLIGAEFGPQPEEKCGGVGADLLHGADCVDADGELLVGEQGCEMGEDAVAAEIATLHEREGAGAAKGSGGVGGAAPDGFELDVPDAYEEEVGLLIFEGGEGLRDRVLGPALGIGLRGILEEAGEPGGKIGREGGKPVVEGKLCGLADDEAVAVSESHCEQGFGGFGSDVAKGLKRGEIGVEASILRHEEGAGVWPAQATGTD